MRCRSLELRNETQRPSKGTADIRQRHRVLPPNRVGASGAVETQRKLDPDRQVSRQGTPQCPIIDCAISDCSEAPARTVGRHVLQVQMGDGAHRIRDILLGLQALTAVGEDVADIVVEPHMRRPDGRDQCCALGAADDQVPRSVAGVLQGERDIGRRTVGEHRGDGFENAPPPRHRSGISDKELCAECGCEGDPLPYHLHRAFAGKIEMRRDRPHAEAGIGDQPRQPPRIPLRKGALVEIDVAFDEGGLHAACAGSGDLLESLFEWIAVEEHRRDGDRPHPPFRLRRLCRKR
jgi:hypothetical protein